MAPKRKPAAKKAAAKTAAKKATSKPLPKPQDDKAETPVYRLDMGESLPSEPANG